MYIHIGSGLGVHSWVCSILKNFVSIFCEKLDCFSVKITIIGIHFVLNCAKIITALLNQGNALLYVHCTYCIVQPETVIHRTRINTEENAALAILLKDDFEE